MSEKPDLETRVQQFSCMQLPGQPMGMHMGTSYLVNDLWSEVKKLREMLEWMNRKGGLGLDVHDRIRAALIEGKSNG